MGPGCGQYRAPPGWKIALSSAFVVGLALIRYPVLMIAALNIVRDHLNVLVVADVGAMRQYLK